MQGNYEGRMAEAGGMLRLVNAQGRLVDRRIHLSMGGLAHWSIGAGLALLGCAILLRRSIRL